MATTTYPYNADLDRLVLYKADTFTVTVPIDDASGDPVNMVTLAPDYVQLHIRDVLADTAALIVKDLNNGITLTSTGVTIDFYSTDLAALDQLTYWGVLTILIGTDLYLAAKPFPIHVYETTAVPVG